MSKMARTVWMALLALALAGVTIASLPGPSFDDVAFSRSYRRCTDRIDAQYQAKIDAEFAQELRDLRARFPEWPLDALPVVPKLMPNERADYDAFIQRRTNCAKWP